MQNSDRQRPGSEVVKLITFIHFTAESGCKILKVKAPSTATVVIPQADAGHVWWAGNAWFI
jgi:hypothetical protein